jgi:hypothetical protein
MKKHLLIRAEEPDIYRWKESAKQADLTLSEWMRRKCNRQPLADSKSIPLSSTPGESQVSKRKVYRRRIPKNEIATTQRPSPAKLLQTSRGKGLPKRRKSSANSELKRAVARKINHKYGCTCFACQKMAEFLTANPKRKQDAL